MKKKVFFILIPLIIIGVGFVLFHFSTNQASAYLSKEEAEEKVSNQFSGKIVELELREENNQKIYEVKIEGADRDYELTIDAETGEIILLHETTETRKNVNEDNNRTTTNEINEDKKEKTTEEKDTLISAEEARAIATNEYPGTITDFELDEDDGIYIYEIEIITDSYEVELEVDAYTGSIISISKDELDD